MDHIEIQMLGEFSLSTKNQHISDTENRSHKVWLLLAYLIYHRHRVVTQQELLDLLWGDDSRGSNPASTLKTTLHRVRSTLDRLWPCAGHQLILYQDGGYIWNIEVPISLDIDEFDARCRTDPTDSDAPLSYLTDTLNLYGGNFLPRLSEIPWVASISAYYHTLYLHTLHKTFPLLLAHNRNEDLKALCQVASSTEPFHEGVHSYLMRALLNLNDADGAVRVYKDFSDRLFSHLGVLPSEEIRTLYRKAIKITNDHALPLESILEQLQEPAGPSGALICDYDFFALLCHSVSRSMSRTGIATHIVLLSVTGKNDEDLPAAKLSRVMNHLLEQIRGNLRRGDTAARCSVSQFILMLPQANYENSCMVSNRIIRSFFRQYPHSPAKIHVSIHPLVPKL